MNNITLTPNNLIIMGSVCQSLVMKKCARLILPGERSLLVPPETAVVNKSLDFPSAHLSAVAAGKNKKE